MPISKLRPSFTFTEDRLAELRAVVPEAFADGKVNWDTLREALGEHLEDEGADAEHFGISWPGKRQARRLAAMPSKGTLVPVPGEGMNEDSTRNIFIEGDNLEVLKLLQKSYAGRVKMIYIDPPYNTGNDLIYQDDYREPLDDYLAKTSQVDEAMELTTSNPRTSGRYHSNWLSMMYPRLLLARTLLRSDGVIFVSIDDHEVHYLRTLMDEVFGPENFIAQVIWQKVYSPRMDDQGISPEHDYILVFGGSPDYIPSRMPFVQNERQFTGFDEGVGKKYRPRSLRKEGKNSRRSDRPNLFYPIAAPNGKPVYPIRSDGTEGCWRVQPETYNKMVEAGVIEWTKVRGDWQPYVKQYYDEEATKPYGTIWPHDQVGHNHEAVDELRRLLGEPVFSNPKPTRLIRRMIEVAGRSDEEPDIILDFFSGSATTADAVLQQSHGDHQRRHFIMVQLPEATNNSKYATIAEIGKERIRRAIKSVRTGAKLNAKEKKASGDDLGFRVFRLDRSGFVAWHDYTGDDPKQLELLFENATSPLVDGWQPNHVLTEVQLLEGFPLDSTVTEMEECKKNKVLCVESDACAHRLLMCLDKKIKDETVEGLQMAPDDVFVCLDSALTDEAKVRLGDLGNLRVI